MFVHMYRRCFFIVFILLCTSLRSVAAKIFIPMDSVRQTNHLRAYGIVYKALTIGVKVDWLLNYKGGCFGMDYTADMLQLCREQGVSCMKMSNDEYADVTDRATGPKYNGEIIKLEQAPKIAVYTPLNKEPWDDAVTLVLSYAGIPFDKLYADEVLAGGLAKYDWLHLHHEDFTGQFGKFWGAYQHAAWYQNDKQTAEKLAARNGFKKVSQLQLAVVKKIRAFVSAGGNLFAMCSATDTYDIALAAENTDICDTQFDGDRMDAAAQSKLNFDKCFAFKDFTVSANPLEYEYSNIDNTGFRYLPQNVDSFNLMTYPAKKEPVAAMLCQNHTAIIAGFMGQTTAFRKEVLKPGVLVMGAQDMVNEARYIHGVCGKGSWTFYGGHDPEDYQHNIGEPPTDLSKHPNSPGYRLILNNILSSAAKKSKAIPTEREVVMPQPAAPVKAPQVSIVPDASTGELIITFGDKGPQNTSGSANRKLSFFNADGKEVVTRNVAGDVVRISINSLPSGIYTIKVDGVYAGKIVRD